MVIYEDPTWYLGNYESLCDACKIEQAVYHITIGRYDQEAALSVCPGCLRNAPTWAGWPTWTQDMKDQRLRHLRSIETPQMPEASEELELEMVF